MSMHEFEDLVEKSVLLLAKTERDDLRDLYKRLYEFQAAFDTGYTHMRVIDHLLSARFVYQIRVEQHPQYSLYAKELNALSAQQSGWLNLIPGSAWSPENPSVARCENSLLYFDAGGPLWKNLVDSGFFIGADAMSPKDKNIFEVAELVIQLAQEQSDLTCVAWWYALIPTVFMNSSGVETLAENSGLLKNFLTTAYSWAHTK